jgi:peptidoglycan hydrolase CwlO-like protein
MDNTDQQMTVKLSPDLETSCHPDVVSAADSIRNACSKCGAFTDGTWDFCGDCGQPLSATSDAVEGDGRTDQGDPHLAVPVPAPPIAAWVETTSTKANSSGRRSRAKTIALTVAILLIVGLAGSLGYLQQRTSDQLRKTDSQLSATSQQLANRSAELESTTDELQASNSELTRTASALQSARQDLKQTRKQLSGIQGTLDTTRHQLDLQANQIETLKSCLNGVSSALSYAAYSDYGAALAALDAVQVSCDKANDLF